VVFLLLVFVIKPDLEFSRVITICVAVSFRSVSRSVYTRVLDVPRHQPVLAAGAWVTVTGIRV
jgi:hypothetical protein